MLAKILRKLDLLDVLIPKTFAYQVSVLDVMELFCIIIRSFQTISRSVPSTRTFIQVSI
jgi:hypothetical protein